MEMKRGSTKGRYESKGGFFKGELYAGVEHGGRLPPHPSPPQVEPHGVVVADRGEGGEGDRHVEGRAREQQARGHGRKDAADSGEDDVRPFVRGVTYAAAHLRGAIKARAAEEGHDIGP